MIKQIINPDEGAIFPYNPKPNPKEKEIANNRLHYLILLCLIVSVSLLVQKRFALFYC